MNKKKILIFSLVFITVVIVGFIAATFLLREKPTLPGRATEAPTDTPQPTGPICLDNSGSCSWSSDETATSFEVKIIDEITGETVLDKTTNENVVYFTPLANHVYKCTVIPINSCGTGVEESAQTICTVEFSPTPSPSDIPTPTEELTPTLTPTGTLTPSPTDELTPTPTDELTPTPTDELTPTPTEEFSPTPTDEATSTPKPSSTPTEIVLISETQPPVTPTIPESGIPANWFFLMMPLVIIIVGLIF